MSNKRVIESLRQEIKTIEARIAELIAMPETVQIHYSLDHQYYYITDTEQDHPEYWLSVANIDKPPLEKISDSPFTPCYLQIKRVITGAEYWKEALPFTFWEVKSGDTEMIDRDSEVYRDYASLMRWKELKNVKV